MKHPPRWTVLAVLLTAGCASDTPIGDRIATAPETPLTTPALSTDIVLSVNPDVEPSQLWTDYGLWPVDALPDGHTYRVRTTGDAGSLMTQIQADDRVAAAELNLPVIGPILRQSSVAFNEGFPTPGDFFEQSLATKLNLELAHAGARGYGVRIAILDTGVDVDHPVLASRLLPGGRDFLDGDLDPSDLPDGLDNDGNGLIDEATGHGTSVAGLVALVAPSARIMALRVLNSDGVGNVYGVAAAIEYAVNRGVRIINLSIGLTQPSSVVDQAIAYAAERNVIMITAAGNIPSGPYLFPATDSRVWAIAAVDGNNVPAAFTSAFQGVVVSAPGVNLQSTYWNGSYAIWSGTSMAAPIVAGTAALILSRNWSLTPGEVRSRIENSATPFKMTVSGMGTGIVNPGAAVGAPGTDGMVGREQANRF